MPLISLSVSEPFELRTKYSVTFDASQCKSFFKITFVSFDQMIFKTCLKLGGLPQIPYNLRMDCRAADYIDMTIVSYRNIFSEVKHRNTHYLKNISILNVYRIRVEQLSLGHQRFKSNRLRT